MEMTTARQLEDVSEELRRHESRPHGYVQQLAGTDRWQFICGWCGAAAETAGRRVRPQLLEHLYDEHGIDTHGSKIGDAGRARA